MQEQEGVFSVGGNIIVSFICNGKLREVEVTKKKIGEIVKKEGLRIDAKKSKEVLEKLGLRMPHNNHPRNKPAFFVIKEVIPSFSWKKENGQVHLEGYPNSGASLATITLKACCILLSFSSDDSDPPF